MLYYEYKWIEHVCLEQFGKKKCLFNWEQVDCEIFKQFQM